MRQIFCGLTYVRHGVDLKLNRKVGDEEYYKWYIPVSPDVISELKWKKGDTLYAKVSGKRLVVEKE